MDHYLGFLFAIVAIGYGLAIAIGTYRVYKIDKELHEMEKKEPGYKPGRTSIPGPR